MTRTSIGGIVYGDLSASQRRVIDQPNVALIGMDSKGRPVVEAMCGIPNRLRRWALTKSGDPADIVEPVRDAEGGG